MGKEEIKKALDSFEDEKYTSSKDILKQEIKDKLADHLNTKLGIEDEIDEGLNERKVGTISLLKQVMDGNTSRIEGTEISKEKAKSIYNIVKDMPSTTQKVLDKMSVKEIQSLFQKVSKGMK